MRFLLCFIFPPLAVLLCGKPMLACLNLLLCILILPAVIHGLVVVSAHKSDKRFDRLGKQIQLGPK